MQDIARKSDALMTIGYQGASIEDFVATLRHTAIEVLVDIRDVPISRKPGFSKKLLAKRLNEVGIRYVHLRELGNPKPGRDAARQGKVEIFKRIFHSHLARPDSQEALSQAAEIATQNRAALLCFESDHSNCHRSIVAGLIANRKQLNVHHLNVIQGLSAKVDRNQNVVEGAYALG